MYIRILVDNCIITYIRDIILNKSHNTRDLSLLIEKASLVYLSNLKSVKLEFLLSEESLAEIEKISSVDKKIELRAVYYAFKKNNPVIKNRSITYNDFGTTYNSPDISYNHDISNNDLNKVKQFLKSKGNENEFDARYIANAMLPINKIDAFLTIDKGIWNYRKEIKNRFNVKVMKPSELSEYYSYTY
jgi:hypothetical protein